MGGLQRITVLFMCLDSLVELVIASLILWVSQDVNNTVYGISVAIVIISILSFLLAILIGLAPPISKRYGITLTLLTLLWLGALVSASVVKGEADRVQDYYQTSTGIQTSTAFTPKLGTKPTSLPSLVSKALQSTTIANAAPKSSATSKTKKANPTSTSQDTHDEPTTTSKKKKPSSTTTDGLNKRSMPTITLIPRSPLAQRLPMPKPAGPAKPVIEEHNPSSNKNNEGTSAPKKTQKASEKIGKEVGDIWWGLVICAAVMVIWCGFLWFHFWKTRKEKVYYEGVGNSNTALVGEPVEPRRMNGDYEDVRI